MGRIKVIFKKILFYICAILLVCLRRPNNKFGSWQEFLFTAIIFCTVDAIYECIKKKKQKQKKASEQTKIEIDYDKFKNDFVLNKTSYVFKYSTFELKIFCENGKFICLIVGEDSETWKKEYNTIDELLTNQIISSRTIQELWNELEIIKIGN